MANIAYHIANAACRITSLLPLRLLYVLSDALYIIIYHAVKYRRRLVRKNLADSFPEKGEAELRAIEKALRLALRLLRGDAQAAHHQPARNQPPHGVRGLRADSPLHGAGQELLALPGPLLQLGVGHVAAAARARSASARRYTTRSRTAPPTCSSSGCAAASAAST